jgi:hypothetical protein
MPKTQEVNGSGSNLLMSYHLEPKPSPSLVFRSRGEPDTTVALSEVKTWDDFLSRCEITEDEIIYMGWDGLGEEKPCCTDREWDSRLEEYHRDGHTGLFVRRQTEEDFQSDA